MINMAILDLSKDFFLRENSKEGIDSQIIQMRYSKNSIIVITL
jgi:hypothetical protein